MESYEDNDYSPYPIQIPQNDFFKHFSEVSCCRIHCVVFIHAQRCKNMHVEKIDLALILKQSSKFALLPLFQQFLDSQRSPLVQLKHIVCWQESLVTQVCSWTH